MKKYNRGFTLTEVLLIASMFAVISLSVFNAFSNGFKLWAKGEQVLVDGNVNIFLDKMAEDVRGVVKISGIPFKGEGTEVSFPAIILAPTDIHSSRALELSGDQMGAIRYSFDPMEKKVYRSQATYGQALKTQWSAPIEVASQIEDISLRYYFTADRGLNVKEEMDEGIPMGIMIDVQFMMDNQVHHMRRFLLIPVGGGI